MNLHVCEYVYAWIHVPVGQGGKNLRGSKIFEPLLRGQTFFVHLTELPAPIISKYAQILVPVGGGGVKRLWPLLGSTSIGTTVEGGGKDFFGISLSYLLVPP